MTRPDAALHPEVPHTCSIIPPRVLERFANDPDLTPQERQYFIDALKVEAQWRHARAEASKLAAVYREALPSAMNALATVAPPSVLVFDCQQGTSLPGTPVANPGSSADPTAKRTFDETTAVVDFYKSIFGRNSLDGAGMTLISSIHFSVNYTNAAWTGVQMKYGDGDGTMFVDFTKAPDVIGHELTHGLTQFTAGLEYLETQSGGLNESMSDVFGSMFRQWRKKQTVTEADWLIGREIIGPGTIARGFTCLRDMANPSAGHCLTPQPSHFSKYHDGMDPHDSSGFPNLAFYKAAMAIGGKSWEKAGQIWFQALTGSGPTPSMKMREFADRTRSLAGTLFTADPSIKSAVDTAWKSVGL